MRLTRNGRERTLVHSAGNVVDEDLGRVSHLLVGHHKELATSEGEATCPHRGLVLEGEELLSGLNIPELGGGVGRPGNKLLGVGYNQRKERMSMGVRTRWQEKWLNALTSDIKAPDGTGVAIV